jgi:alkanesulfonate monooxygenase SsuD/methylene tetrahydromethanopterin reductase-like flavin-dependent oxidoreductase (luciferase family)
MLGLPLMIAIIGGSPKRFAPLVGLYREAVRRGEEQRGEHADTDASRPDGFPHSGTAVGINSHMYISDTAERARDEFFGPYSQMMNRIGRERGWGPMGRAQFDAGCSPEGHLLVGTPKGVAEKIVSHHGMFDNDRFLGHISVGVLAHEKAMRATELFATEVAPIVRERLRESALAEGGREGSATVGTPTPHTGSRRRGGSLRFPNA